MGAFLFGVIIGALVVVVMQAIYSLRLPEESDDEV